MSTALNTVNSRLCLGLIAALALVATGAVFTGESGAAYSGGLEAPSGDRGDSAPRMSSKFDRLWRAFSARDRRWANRTSECESGRNPRAIGGGGLYRGAFQFMKSTWRRSPRSPGGDPIVYSYRVQAVVAVLLMKRDGPGHWPVCG
jgi:hypothetical protein